ncbi:hypothetical protein [Mesorhizobium onobrychidis]|uniref:Uncharacterized protein n=1 Tax=Mesorhizobium onobrychidis TaxID=2775404 RepID=A0ABY5QS75_9HYPH|nr:hypothetical protein [Mesorhizobium onobrychidis]UVC13337.1 hypothetical protein IHQ72_21685 [Mesorhizobium onobrychidis]
MLLADGCEGRPAILMRNLADFAALAGSIPAGEPIATPQDYVAAFK